MKTKLSKFAPIDGFPNLPIIDGIKLSAINAGISKQNKRDLLLIEGSRNAIICGLFTKSETCSAAVDWSRENIKKSQNKDKPIGILVNSGNANVFTGKAGINTVKETVLSVAQHLNTSKENVFVASTGVIGELLNYQKITSQVGNLTKYLTPNNFSNAAQAIMTTDTYPKGVHAKLVLGQAQVNINGIAKGSGMIAPNMATMLVFIFSDASIKKSVLQKIITNCNNNSFNCITVDSDMSTSDSLFVIATGRSKMPQITSITDPRAIQFEKCLAKTMLDLAHLVIKDGEGISKFIEVTVKGADNRKAAFNIGKSIAESPLVKTAFAGEDPNWGRIVMAIGKSGFKVNKEKISIFFGNNIVAENGERSREYDELTVTEYMKNDSLIITVDLKSGSGVASIYTCDLTHDYISINADYRS